MGTCFQPLGCAENLTSEIQATATTTPITQYKALLVCDKPEKEIEYVHTKTHRSTGIVYGATTIRQSYHLVEEEWYFKN